MIFCPGGSFETMLAVFIGIDNTKLFVAMLTQIATK